MSDESGLNDLTDGQREMLLNFSEITDISDLNLCRSILSNNDWNLEVSVENYIRNRDIRQSSHSQSSAGGNGNSSALPSRQQGQRGFLNYFTSTLRWLFQSSPESLNPQQDAARFCDSFKLEYGEDGPQFHDISYNNAVAEAYRQSKFLLVYLHSPLHEDTDRFCR